MVKWGVEMSKTIVRAYSPKSGSSAHKLLALLFYGQLDERSLCSKTRTTNQSLNLWRSKVLEPLWEAGWIELNNNLYGLTPSGLAKLQAMEEIKPQLESATPQVATKMRRYSEESSYTGLAMSSVRPGAMDFLALPSREGSRLVYRKDVENAE